ncbi:MAG TPA: hypothetical protein VFX07_05750 [Candidatus Udaeobacter sp.]|jgi:hypothetical protein|nr:hypothetical protein [Candidatus Udaeobacter sp.]
MLKRVLWAAICSLIFVVSIDAQEVIVAREKKSERAKETPSPAEQLASESPTPTPRKKAREKKSAPAVLSLEEMRAAGARAAEGGDERSGPESNKTHHPDVQSAPMPNPAFAETPRPVKRETPAEQRSSSHHSGSRGTNIEDLGPIRPTLLESGREAPSPSPR